MGELINYISQKIDEGLLNNKEGPRNYLGASSLGTECDRQLWYSYHQPKRVNDPKKLRIFKVGHYLEPMVVDLLRKGGFTVYSENHDGSQFGFNDGKIAGHCDGVIIINDEPYLLEIKTAKSTKFKEFKKMGFLHNNRYRVQVNIYMNKFRLKKCLAVVICKDTQELYLEIIDYDQITAEHYLERGHWIANTSNMPDRIAKTKMNFGCKYCDHYEECWNENSST